MKSSVCAAVDLFYTINYCYGICMMQYCSTPLLSMSLYDHARHKHYHLHVGKINCRIYVVDIRLVT